MRTVRNTYFRKCQDHPYAKLTNEQVTEIRTLYEAGGITQKELAKRYGVSISQICKIVNGYYWRM